MLFNGLAGMGLIDGMASIIGTSKPERQTFFLPVEKTLSQEEAWMKDGDAIANDWKITGDFIYSAMNRFRDGTIIHV